MILRAVLVAIAIGLGALALLGGVAMFMALSGRRYPARPTGTRTQ